MLNYNLEKSLQSGFLRHISGYGIIGIMMMALSVILYFIFIDKLGFNMYLMYIVVNILTTTISYFLNSRYTFQQSVSFKSFIKYGLTYIIGICVGLVLLKIINHTFIELSDFFTVLCSIVPRIIITFLLLKIIVFK